MQDLIIGVDRRPLANGTGVATYAQSLFAALPIGGIDPWAIEAGDPRLGLRGKVANWSAASLPGAHHAPAQGRALVWRDMFRIAQVHFTMYRRPLRLRAPFSGGVMHWSYPLPLYLEGWTNLYTVHDLIPLTDPALTPIDPARHGRLIAALARCADGFITVSEASRVELITHMAIDPTRVWNCGATAAPAVAGTGARPRDYLLVCGAIEPRKNIVRIAAAHAASGTRLPLVIAGPEGWRADAVRHAVGDRPRVRWLGYQPRADLLALIAGARALLMPSLAEGFGLPVLEAMTLGTPVVTSDRGALAEVAGGAALLVDPQDVAAIASAIGEVAADDMLADRLATAGRHRAAHFTPERFAARLATTYARAVVPHQREARRGD